MWNQRKNIYVLQTKFYIIWNEEYLKTSNFIFVFERNGIVDYR